MADEGGFDHAAVYEIAVRGRLDERWAGWFDGMQVRLEQRPGGGLVTFMTGPVADQAALRGILNRMWDLHLTVTTVIRTGTDES